MDSYKQLDAAIDNHIRSTEIDGIFTTGWVIICSVSSVGHDETNSDGYLTFTSDGLPHHSQIGLLSVALDDRRNMSMLSKITLALSDEEDEWDND